MKFSIIIVTFNRKKGLMECLKSICEQSLKISHEVIVILNGDLSYLEKYKASFPLFKFIHLPQTTPSNARNFAVSCAMGEYVLFLDEDCQLPRDYFQNINFDMGWDVLGGPDQPQLHAGLRETLIARTLASPLCMGPAFKRHSRNSLYDRKASEESLVICNLWFKRSIFTSEGFQFDKSLFRNEEHFLLKEMLKKEKIFHYNPDLFVYHQRLPDLEKLGAALIQSAKSRVTAFSIMSKKNEFVYFLPSIFSVCFFFLIFHPNTIFLTAFLIYTLMVLIYGMITHHRLSLRLVLLHYFVLFSYNVGLFKGCWCFCRKFLQKTQLS